MRPMASLCAETAPYAPGTRVPTFIGRPGCFGEQMAVLPAGRWPLAAGAHVLPNASPRQDLVFVKLTDSALRAIEHYVANQRKIGSSPTIQFLSENEGKISIPSTGAADPQNSMFLFSLASNADLEGPQGSFQCLQAGVNGVNKSLRALGSMPTRMRVQANDDVYETTKHRMAIGVENQKSKCTRVIKPNQTDIGRKVKVKQQRPPPSRHPITPSPPVQQHPYSNTSNGHSTHSYNSNTGTNGYDSGGGGPYNQINGNNHHNTNRPIHNSVPTTNKFTQQATKPTGDDVQKCPIRDRLIQLLALKPFKKPEIYARINSEGIKEKERNVIPCILQTISYLKDNCYHLHRHLWNDVQEDWKYYTEEEKQILKRRKPQNLTPPLSSDSGHSPSPPPGKRLASSLPSSNVVPIVQPPPKKQRISHCKRPQETSRESGDGSPAALSNGYHSSTSTSGASSGERKNYSDEETPIQTNLAPSKRDNSYSVNFIQSKNFINNTTKQNGYQTSPSIEHISSEKGLCSPLSLDKRSPIQVNGGQPPPQRRDKKSPDSTTQPTHSPAPPPPATPPDMTGMPDYETQFTEITSQEQRRRYKTEFSSQYEEYRVIHVRILDVVEKFSRLEERLNNEKPGHPNHRELKRQILEEYQNLQRDGRHQRDVDKFNYLHQKLAHIKHLVGKYDRIHTATY